MNVLVSGFLFDERTHLVDLYFPAAHLLSAVPSGYPVDPVSGGQCEGAGVRPDIAVPAEEAFDIGYRLALEHVLGLGEEDARHQIAEDARNALTRLRGR